MAKKGKKGKSGGKKGGKKGGGKKGGGKKGKKGGKKGKKGAAKESGPDPSLLRKYWLEESFQPAKAGDMINGVLIEEPPPEPIPEKPQYPSFVARYDPNKLPRIRSAEPAESESDSDDSDDVPREEYCPWGQDQQITGRKLHHRANKGRDIFATAMSMQIHQETVDEMRYRLGNAVHAAPRRLNNTYNPSRYSRGQIASAQEMRRLKELQPPSR